MLITCRAGDKVSVKHLLWGDGSPLAELGLEERPDIVIGSGIIYGKVIPSD